jgi:Cys-rich repeat protein
MVASRVVALLLILGLGACNLGGAVEACAQDAECPEGSTCDTELQACKAPTGEPAQDAADAGR